ncbi:hypothetical protein ACFSUD_12810, partial [Sulfitobacter aestuarii]
MFDTTPQAVQSGTIPATALDELLAFVGMHRDALIDAAGLLGADPGIRLAQAALDGLAEPGTPSRRTMRAFGDLLDLLKLEHVHDTTRIEARLFAVIDPASACAEEIVSGRGIALSVQLDVLKFHGSRSSMR